MSKTRKYVVNGIVTPEMLADTNQKAVPKDVVRIIKTIAGAQEKTEKSAYTIAYNLALLQYDTDKDNTLVKKMGYKDIRDFAEVFFNIAPATAYCYAQTAHETLFKDSTGIHSLYCDKVLDENGNILKCDDFTVTQLQELRGIKPAIIHKMLENGTLDYKNTTKGMRARMQIVKQLTDSKSKYYMGDVEPEEIANKVALIAPMLAIKGNDTGIKAIEAYEKANAPTDTTETTETPTETAETPTGTAETVETPTETAEPADTLQAIENLIEVALKNCDLTQLQALLEYGLDEIAEMRANNND